PVLVESPKMIEPDDVLQLKRPADAGDPPGISGLSEDLPAIQRASPSLPGRAEIIRGNSRHYPRAPALIQLEQLALHPYICALMGDKDRHISDDGDLALLCRSTQIRPLREEPELEITLEGYLFHQSLPGSGKRLRLTCRQVSVPLGPGSAVVGGFESRKE